MKDLLLASLVALVAAGGCTAFKRLAYDGFGLRDRWQHPERVIRALELREGQRVADLGAGGGYFTFRLAKAVGASGVVYAVDVDDGMIRYLEKRASEEGYRNVRTVRAAVDDLRLPEEVDLIFTCNTYHHLEDRAAYFRRAAARLRSGGQVVIIDYTGEGYRPGAVLQRLTGHAVPARRIRGEMEAAGYRLEREHGFLPRQSLLVFVRDGA
ncbi:MAG: class I SAM-dependent methyltransferase [Candidatus Binatia bacterium]